MEDAWTIRAVIDCAGSSLGRVRLSLPESEHDEIILFVSEAFFRTALDHAEQISSIFRKGVDGVWRFDGFECRVDLGLRGLACYARGSL